MPEVHRRTLVAPAPPALGPIASPLLAVQGLTVRIGARTLLRNVGLAVGAREVVAIVGPSGAGKTTLLKCLNRLIDLVPGSQVSGTVQFHGCSLYGPGTDPDALRRAIGMLFQQPVVFPGSVLDNVLFGLVRHRRLGRADKLAAARRALTEAALWEEVADRLGASAASLSTGQQQRLCLARTLALEPEVVLMDEPTSALDPRSTAAIEELVLRLKARHSVVLVTHNLAQAERVADRIACVCVRDGAGELLACAPSAELFTEPQCCEVMAFLGRGENATQEAPCCP